MSLRLSRFIRDRGFRAYAVLSVQARNFLTALGLCSQDWRVTDVRTVTMLSHLCWWRLEKELVCPACGEHFYAPSAEELSFNSQGACRKCDGTGTVRTVDESTLVPDENLTIDRRGCGSLEHADVVSDERCLPSDGGAHRCPVQGSD